MIYISSKEYASIIWHRPQLLFSPEKYHCHLLLTEFLQAIVSKGSLQILSMRLKYYCKVSFSASIIYLLVAHLIHERTNLHLKI